MRYATDTQKKKEIEENKANISSHLQWSVRWKRDHYDKFKESVSASV